MGDEDGIQGVGHNESIGGDVKYWQNLMGSYVKQHGKTEYEDRLAKEIALLARIDMSTVTDTFSRLGDTFTRYFESMGVTAKATFQHPVKGYSVPPGIIDEVNPSHLKEEIEEWEALTPGQRILRSRKFNHGPVQNPHSKRGRKK